MSASGYLVGQAMANEASRTKELLADLDAMKDHLRARSKVLKVEKAMASAASQVQAEIQIELIEQSLGRSIPPEHARMSNPANRELRNRAYEQKAIKAMCTSVFPEDDVFIKRVFSAAPDRKLIK